MALPARAHRSRWPARPLRLALGLVAAVVVAGAAGEIAGPGRPWVAAGVATAMAIAWLTEALPIHWTACLPLLAFPLLGVTGGGLTADLGALGRAYFDPYLFLFAGGMGIAAAMQHCALHRRIALGILRAIGTEPRRLVWGTLAATAFVSLWITNTATATMMFPIALALIKELEAESGGRRLPHFGMALMLAVAYGANLGGIGTKIGTAPNLQFAGFMARRGTEIGFLDFLAIGLPFVFLLFPLVASALWRLGREDRLESAAGREVIARETAALGTLRREEKLVLATFLVATALWISGKLLTGWLAALLPAFRLGSAHVEASIAVGAALVLRLARPGGRTLLPLAALRQIPWETLLLLGGGFAMAAGIQESGLSSWLGGSLAGVAGQPGWQQVVLASLMTVALTAVASNTATIAVMLVVLADAVSPQLLPTVLFAATIASSCDFALPAGTPPNAIVFGSGYIRLPRMARIGFSLDLAAALLAALWCWWAVPALL